ncbi:MAG: 3,4-dihydroxy-2-butanone-4-phosphate synthase [Gammaproteobacteria bacterium]|nr:3,4-dihydroxy-2-butanone-4-phosphate synthase [Gammaproteobacteria bacterium]
MTFDSTERIIEEIRQGRMVILVDDEDRENEGDLVMAAGAVTPEHINFMATYARGLICLTLTEERCQRLGLKHMVETNRSSHGTNFTCSVDAAEGISTGISAADRAHTVQLAVAPQASPRDLVQPGHIFPIMAQPGGVLSRAGHTEAGCDLARLAGLEPAAVIVEIMNPDGTMARRADLERFSQEHDLRIGTIEGLIHYRLANETTVVCHKIRRVQTSFGEFELRTYLDTARNQIHHAMIKGELNGDRPVLTRVHVPSPLRDIFALVEPGPKQVTRWTVHDAMRRIAAEGSGVIIIVNVDMAPSDIVERQLEMLFDNRDRAPQTRHNAIIQVGVGGQILRDLGVRQMRLMGAQVKYTGIAGFDLEVVEFVPPPAH